MKIIYLDELFLLNLVIDYFLLLATAQICSLPYRRWLFALGAGVGSLWSCLSIVPCFSFLNAPLLRPGAAVAMTLIAFGKDKKLLRCFLAFVGVSALFGGAVYAATLWQGTGTVSGPLIHISMRVLILSFALCWALVSFIFRRSIEHSRQQYLTVTLEKNGRRTQFQALRDTGNRLHDPLTGCGVLVAEAEALRPLFPHTDTATLQGPAPDAVTAIPGGRLIPCASIGGEKRLLLAFRPDKVIVDGEERHDLLAAVSPAPIGTDGVYRAVL